MLSDKQRRFNVLVLWELEVGSSRWTCALLSDSCCNFPKYIVATRLKEETFLNERLVYVLLQHMSIIKCLLESNAGSIQQ